MQESLAIRMVMGVAAGTALSAGASYEHARAEDIEVQVESGDATEQSYEVTGGETAAGIALRYGATEADIIASNPNVDFSVLQPGQRIVVPTLGSSEPIQAPEQPSPESVVQLSGYEVVVTSGQQPDTAAVNAGITNAVVEQPNSSSASFTNLPFQQQEVLPISSSTEQQITEEQHTSSQLMGAESQSPISITTNAPSRIEIAPSGAISIEVTAQTQTLTQNVPQPIMPQHTTAVEATPQVEAAPVTVNQETIVPATGAYKDFLQAMPVSAEPLAVVDLKEKDVYESGALKVRSAAYPEKMAWLEQNTSPLITPQAYALFKENGINMSLAAQNIFAEELPGTKLSRVQCFTMHWMAGDVTDAQAAAQAMLHRDVKANVQLMTMPDGVPYLITGALDDKAFHAGKANEWCVGNEIAGEDLLDFTPQQAMTNIMLTVFLHREYGMPLVRDIATIEAQPLNMYSDFTPIPRTNPEDFVGPIGHLEVENANKLDPTVMFVNYVYEQAFALNAQLDQQLPIAQEQPIQAIGEQTAINTLSNASSGAQQYAGGLSISQLLRQPIFTEQQEALQERAEQQGFTLQSNAAPVVAAQSQASSLALVPDALPEQAALHDLTGLLSEAAHTYVVRNPVLAVQTSSQSVQNGGELSYEQAYGPALQVSDVYAYVRQAGATHTEAVVLTAISARETGLRPGAVGDLRVIDGAFMPSYGLFQIRDIKDGNPLRDPAANLSPQLAAHNALQLLRENGGGPWEVEVPQTVTSQSLFEAIRLPERQKEDRIAFDARMQAVAQDVLVAAQAMNAAMQGGQPM